MIKFLAYSSVVFLYLLCFTEAVPELDPESTATALTFNSSCGAPGITELGCFFVGYFVVSVSLVCRLMQSVTNVPDFIACVSFVARLPYPISKIFSDIFNEIYFGAKGTSSVCPVGVNILTSSASILCPGILAKLFVLLSKLVYNGGGSSEVTCGNSDNNQLACSLLSIFYILSIVICKLDALGVDLGTFIACVSVFLPRAIATILQIIVNGLKEGGETTLSLCPYVTKKYHDSINEYCLGFFDSFDIALAFSL